MSETPRHIRQLILLDKIRVAGEELETLLQEPDNTIPAGATEQLERELELLGETVMAAWHEVVNTMPREGGA